MTGYRCKHFRYDCQQRGCYIDLLPSWDDLIEVFPRHIRPTDVDGMVEINGHILILEEKTQGKPLDNGQRRALKALTERPHTTVVVFRPGSVSDLEVLILANGATPEGYQRVSRDWFRGWLRAWARAADQTQLGPL